MKKLLIVFCSVVLFGCAVTMTNEMNNLEVGMSKKAVLDEMGEPDRVSANSKTQYLLYRLIHPKKTYGKMEEYFVKIVDGEVESFGKVGDFDTKQVYEKPATIDVHLK